MPGIFAVWNHVWQTRKLRCGQRGRHQRHADQDRDRVLHSWGRALIVVPRSPATGCEIPSGAAPPAYAELLSNLVQRVRDVFTNSIGLFNCQPRSPDRFGLNRPNQNSETRPVIGAGYQAAASLPRWTGTRRSSSSKTATNSRRAPSPSRNRACSCGQLVARSRTAWARRIASSVRNSHATCRR